MPPAVPRGGNGGAGVFVSLGAAEPSPAFNSRASRASSASFEEEETACDYSSTEEEEQSAYGDYSWGDEGEAWAAALRGATGGEFDGRGLTHPALGAFGEWPHRYGAWQREARPEVERVCETGEWKRERMLYDAQTLPVRFQRP